MPTAIRELEALWRVDRDLAYLAVLTCDGVKPLSRWERPLAGAELSALRGLGLTARTVTRLTERAGRESEDVVFAIEPEMIDRYVDVFDHQPLRISTALGRLEGHLFGFPSCCVDAFLSTPYTPNDLAPETQAILFHWACRGCRVTPLLVPRYRRALAVANARQRA